MKKTRSILLTVISVIMSLWMAGSVLANGNNEFVFPYSAIAYLIRQDVAQLSLQELCMQEMKSLPVLEEASNLHNYRIVYILRLAIPVQ